VVGSSETPLVHVGLMKVAAIELHTLLLPDFNAGGARRDGEVQNRPEEVLQQ